MGYEIRCRRVYVAPRQDDGYRVLVERLWPRGVRKADAAIDLWLKEIAPSTALRQWFAHDPEHWPSFTARYRAELELRPDAVAELLGRSRQGPLTLIYAARDEEHNSAQVLRQYLLDLLAREN